MNKILFKDLWEIIKIDEKFTEIHICQSNSIFLKHRINGWHDIKDEHLIFLRKYSDYEVISIFSESNENYSSNYLVVQLLESENE